MEESKATLVIDSAIDCRLSLLKTVGHKIWENPELNFKEHFASSLLIKTLEAEGFSMERNVAGMSTAFKATFGSSRPNVAILCEYDALPNIGHGCGHNLIAEAGIVAAVGIKAVLEKMPNLKGTITVLGTPAEECGGGKIVLLKAGYFDCVDVAMMVHPASCNDVTPIVLKAHEIEVTFEGKEAHASAFPWEGRNALDAAVMAYNSLSLLRQQMKPTWRLQSVISHGGAETYVIPSESRIKVCIRAPESSEYKILYGKVYACLESAAVATNCKLLIKETGFNYEGLRSNHTLAEVFRKHCISLKIDLSNPHNNREPKLLLSSDMGDVSQCVPSIHPLYCIGSAFNHTIEFTELADTSRAHDITIAMGKALAMTAADVMKNQMLLSDIQSEFKTNVVL